MPLIDINGLGHFKDKENEMIAADYSATKTYAVGDYVYYNGVLKRCTTAITTAEAYTAAHWANAVLADDVTELKTASNYDIKTIFNINRAYSLELVVNGTMQPGGNNGSNSAKNTRTDYLNYSESMIVYMDNADYEFCVWGYPGKSTANRVAFTNSAYISSDKTVIIKKTSNLHYFRIGFHRKDGANLTTDLTNPASDFSIISSSIHFYSLASDYDLYPTGDTTARGTEILDFINTTGKCRLAPGDYYIERLYFPEGAVLVGAGKDKTRIICDGTTTTYGIKLRKNSYVANLTVECYQENGNLTPVEDYSLGANGIQIGNIESPLLDAYNVTIENVYVKNFSGCGIFCRYVGQETIGSIFRNVRVEYCSAGFYFGEYAEYNTLIGCNARNCYTGAVVMGGNNIVADSIFGSVEVGISLPESDGYGEGTGNDAHGIITGCKISHTGKYSETNGISIKSEGQASGQIIVGCMFGSFVYVKDRGKGLHFSGCQFRGESPEITIDNSIVQVTSCTFVTGGTTGITVLNGGKFIRTGCVDFNGNVLASVT